jgi:hypothetical protein
MRRNFSLTAAHRRILWIALLTLSVRAVSGDSLADQYQSLSEIAATDGIQQAFAQLEREVPTDDAARVRSWLALALLASDFKKLAEVLNVVSSRQNIGIPLTKKTWRAILQSDRGNIIAGATWRAVRSDKKAALDIIDEQLDGAEKDKALLCAVMELVQERMFTDAKEIIARMRLCDERYTAVINVAHNFCRQNVPGALEWSSSLEGKEYAGAISSILDALVDKKDIDGLKTTLDWNWEPETRTRAIKNIITLSLEREDTAGISSFVDTLIGDERRMAGQHLAKKLAKRGGR